MLRQDIIDHRDIMLLSLFTGCEPMRLLNVYSNAQHTAITWLSRNIAHLPPVSYMAGNFNSHSAVWDDGVLHQYWDSNLLIKSGPCSNPYHTATRP